MLRGVPTGMKFSGVRFYPTVRVLQQVIVHTPGTTGICLLRTASRSTIRCFHSGTYPPETVHVFYRCSSARMPLIRASAGWCIARGQYMKEGGMRAVDPARERSHTRYKVIVSRKFLHTVLRHVTRTLRLNVQCLLCQATRI